ncbi:short chain amide porin [Chitinophaga jiangningensis]|uniref:Short chain amide porin n=1 Tax=Chitinophaga jiangningensis TaxID=1419482 RepID=A0A1M7CKA8_9BACT|nr:hypothetical protein [Chitinophaga jiangningensis]SHL67630.1 short chain amide porin [Chitinophaga jiangningensis]
MKSAILFITLSTLSLIVKAEDDPPKSKKKKRNYLIELPASLNTDSVVATGTSTPAVDLPFKPSIQVGAIVHMFASGEQTGYSNPSADKSAKDWNKGFSLYRARVLVGGQLTKKASFFLETEIPSPIGIQSNGEKNVKVSPIILDAQLEYTFSNAFQLIAGMQLVSNNRNGLQGAAGLMANDFSYFQYPYNLFSNSPLQGNFGRDLGINARGFLANDKLEYRLGVFTGRNIDGGAPLRTVGRLAYNFLDAEKDFYYAGTKLGKGKTLAWAAGFDAQANYINYSTDVFFDYPLGNAGSITANAAFQYLSGGTDLSSKYSFATLIPKQTIQFLELGYYFKKVKLQPWIRYENQAISAEAEQTGGIKTASFDKVNSSSVMGGGLNYFFNGTGTNLRLSYTTRTYNVPTAADDYTKKTFGQIWLQAQFFIF